MEVYCGPSDTGRWVALHPVDGWCDKPHKVSPVSDTVVRKNKQTCMFRVTDLGAAEHGALGCGSSRGWLVQRAAQDVYGKITERNPIVIPTTQIDVSCARALVLSPA